MHMVTHAKLCTHAKSLRIVSAALLVVAALACGGRPRAPQPAVRIAAASDLRFALDELTGAFERAHADLGVSVSYGSSGNFYAQLLNGAPFDMFLSADLSYPRQLEQRQLIVPGSAFTYGVGRLVVWVPSASALDVEQQGLRALADPRAAHVAIANPAHAPYGRAAEAALQSAGVYDTVKGRLVLGESVSQALQFVQSGAADAGVVALSLALSPSVAAHGRYAAVPLDRYPRMEQGGAVMRAARNRDAAMAFRAFMLGAPARAVLKRFGFFLRRPDVDWTAIWVSVRLSAATMAILLVVGMPIAYWTAFSRWRFKFLVEAIVALPLVLPPTVLGFYILVTIGRNSPIGRFYAHLTGGGLPFTFAGLLLASVIYSLPFAVQPFSAAFASVDRRLLEASWSLGASRAATFRRVVLPLSIRGVITGMVLSFAHTLGEFGVVLMVGGNLPGTTRTISISIYDSVQALDYTAAADTSLLLLAVSFAILSITYALQKSVWAAWPIY